jgi:molybdopterin/thiamine biosynthesis adenylyltransferase
MPDEALAPWFERRPDRLEWELAGLRDAGLEPEEVEVSPCLVIGVDIPHSPDPIRLEVTFPSGYPQVAPKISSSEQVLERHQGLSSLSNICVLADPDNDWNPTRSASELVLNAQQMLVAGAVGGDALEAGEADLPEPISMLVPHRSDAVVVIPEAGIGDSLGGTRGTFKLMSTKDGSRLLLKDLRCDEGPQVISKPEGTEAFLGPGDTNLISGRWTEVKLSPGISAVGEIWQAAEALASRLIKARRRLKKSAWVGITFMEEAPTRDQQQRSWLFFEFRERNGELTCRDNRAVRTQAWADSVRSLRIPELRSLRQASLLVLGAGSLGGEIVLQLAKAGAGRIDVFDHDSYDLNNSVRHVLPVACAGENKAHAVSSLARSMNPSSLIVPHGWAVGTSLAHDRDFEQMLQDADLVVDATGSQAVTRWAHDACSRTDVPLIVVNLSRGAYGGRVVRLVGPSPCYDCFLECLEDETICDVPSAPKGPGTTPYGCSHPAASGAGFDVSELASIATRRAVQELETEGYPESDADWTLVSFRGVEAGARYREGSLDRRHDCSICGAQEE